MDSAAMRDARDSAAWRASTTPLGGRQRSQSDAADQELLPCWPFLGSRRLVVLLVADGIRVNCTRMRRRVGLIAIVLLGPKPRTSKPGAGHKVLPYLLPGSGD
jgi:hypothetical protein